MPQQLYIATNTSVVTSPSLSISLPGSVKEDESKEATLAMRRQQVEDESQQRLTSLREFNETYLLCKSPASSTDGATELNTAATLAMMMTYRSVVASR